MIRYPLHVEALDAEALGLPSGAYMVDAPLTGACAFAEVTLLASAPSDTPTIPAAAQNILLRALPRTGGPCPEAGMFTSAEHLAAWQKDAAAWQPRPRLPGNFDRSRVALTAYFIVATEWGVPLNAAVEACPAPGYTRLDVEAIASEVYAAGFSAPGTKGQALRDEIGRRARLAAEKIEREAREAERLAKRTPVRAFAVDFDEKFNARHCPDGDLAFVWGRHGGWPKMRLIFDARGVIGPLADMTLCRGLTLRAVGDLALTNAELADACRLGQFPGLVRLIAEAREGAVTAARAEYVGPTTLSRDERTWRRKLATEALVAMRRTGQLVDEQSRPTQAAADVGVAVGLPDVDVVGLLRDALPSTDIEVIETTVASRAPVFMPLELLRDPSPEERRAHARESGLLHERVGAFLADRAMTTFAAVKSFLVGEALVKNDEDPREAAEVRATLELAGWRQGEQIGADGKRHRIWKAPAEQVA